MVLYLMYGPGNAGSLVFSLVISARYCLDRECLWTSIYFNIVFAHFAPTCDDFDWLLRLLLRRSYRLFAMILLIEYAVFGLMLHVTNV